VNRRTAAGFSLLEMVVVVSIALVLSAMAIPMTINAMRSYKLNAAVAAATGAIQSTRYAAIMHGYPGTGVPGYGYEITFTPSTNSYQVYSMVPPATTYSAVGSPIPISRPGDVTISRTVTFQFSAGGTVTETSNPVNMAFQITNAYGGSNTITVTGVGNVSVTSP
jgi:prepilin-type N-terminal cleavage/methylation domain-containing protein